MIPFSICAEITGAALAGSAGGIFRTAGGVGLNAVPGGSGRARLDLSQKAFRPGSGERPIRSVKGPSRSERGPPLRGQGVIP